MKSSSPADPPELVPLDAAPATDAAVVGAKAASLARARRAGLPVLPGYVVPVAAAVPAAQAAAQAAERSPAAARRAVLGHRLPPALAAALPAAVTALGGRVIVRSSSPLEGDHRWSGAFSSINEVGPADAAAAVRSCWASGFGPDPLARADECGVPLAQLAIAALLQPELAPSAGGIARIVADRVEVTAVAGHPGKLLAGWAAGQRTVAAPTDPVAQLARRVADQLGQDLIEWAACGDALYLLQAGRSLAPAPPVRPAAGATLAGRRVRGTPVVAGDAVGRLRYVRAHEPAPADRAILVCDRPVPALAPLLFGAAGLVSLAGPAECHLIEVARSLGVPCLVDTPVEQLTGPPTQINTGDWLAAIDGGRNELVVLPSGAGEVPEELPHAFRKITSSLATGTGSGQEGRWSIP